MQEYQKQRLQKLLEVFQGLNPDIVSSIERELTKLVAELGTEAYAPLEDAADALIKTFLASPVKRAEQNILREYYYFINKMSKRLIRSGELPDQEPPPSNASVALVPEYYYSSLKWLELNRKSAVPIPLADAIDAAQRRNLTVDSVLEPMFRMMLGADRERALEWQVQLCAEGESALDPDIARDLVRAWEGQSELPTSVLRQVLKWSSDEMALRHWPALAVAADKLLRRHGLMAWEDQGVQRLTLAIQLQKLHPFHDPERLRRWFREAISQMGDMVDFFCEQGERLTVSDPNSADDQRWRQDAMFREVLWLSAMLAPILLISDLLLSRANGSFEFAMAFFGFTTQYRKLWRQRLLERCRKAVNRVILRDIRLRRPPLETLHTLSFGNEEFQEGLMAELDLASQTFDSIAQKDIIVDRLAHMYASYREPPILAQEIARRYRRLMRVLHEDNLNRVLRDEHLAELAGKQRILTELATLAASTRRFISQRNSLKSATNEELLALDEEFHLDIRQLRNRYIHQLLKL